jgi:hypothetical protein
MIDERAPLQRTDDPDICFMPADPVTLWTIGIVEWRIDTRGGKFVITPIMRNRSEGPPLDVNRDARKIHARAAVTSAELQEAVARRQSVLVFDGSGSKWLFDH